MRRFVTILVSLSWSLWFGGLITLFIAVTSLFRSFSNARPVAGFGAAGIFHAFEKYQLVLAAVLLLSLAAWQIVPSWRSAGGGLKTAMFVFIALATLIAVSSTLLITPRIDAMRVGGQTGSPEFARMHGISMVLFLSESAFLFLGGLMLPGAIARDAIMPAGTLGTAQATARG